MPNNPPNRIDTGPSGPKRAVPADSTPATIAVVGIGASAGGLDACKRLLAALPADSGMVFILVQHLDPTHQSMLVELLANHTSMAVSQATDGMPLEADHFYIIPPAVYLSVAAGALHLSQPQGKHGSRMPFDFLLHSLASAYGPRAACIILSGTGADGSIGLRAIKDAGGLVIAQNPKEADYDGMPRNAIATGYVDFVLPVAQMPDALLRLGDQQHGDAPRDWLAAIIGLLRDKTSHDFTLYKSGTLQRRIERRMGMAATGATDMQQYLEILRRDPRELDLLAKDLLINVTSFFRDARVFDRLAEKIIPDIVRAHEPDRPIRIWVAGCSTGEETYSLAMVFREQIVAAKLGIKLQIFASDVDSDAVAVARDGLYPETIAADVSSDRLARFFSKEDHGYRISPELRSAVVFTVQDVLTDPPFSRLDFVSCRNLLIYLRPEAQTKVLSLFHFALEPGGILLLGTAETIGILDARFESISKADRIFRHTGRTRPGELGFSGAIGDLSRFAQRLGQQPALSRQAVLADLCQRLVMETYAPAAVLIDRKHECLYSLGPTDRYLRVVPGYPSHDLLAMVRLGMRTKLRSAIQRATRERARIVVPGGRVKNDGQMDSFSIAVQPVNSDGEDLFLVCFVENPKFAKPASSGHAGREGPRVAELQNELEETRIELQGAIHNLEISSEEQKAINEEALSVQEEYQSTNEELLTSKEELQSLNEELTALNSQLQETLERQRTTSNDLENVLYSTDVATLFLDQDLKIRFFTPATRALFAILPTDVGRPLSDLNALAADADLLIDARTVLRTLEPIAREIEARNGAIYQRRVLPYRTRDEGVEGVVITFADITDRRRSADELGVAKRNAEQANAAKSRFLAAASHDLRQPLQTLALVQGLLAKTVETEKARQLVSRLDQTLGAMTGMLNALLDINQIETGIVDPEIADFPIAGLLNELREEFSYHARAKGLTLTVMPCRLSVRSDPRLLEQMVRNLIANALKYTMRGKVLRGGRRHGDRLTIESWDTGIGIAENELKAIFEEYHQIDNPARERSRGLGLGLSIVHRLGLLLGHPVNVRSRPGKGSVFSVEVARSPGGIAGADPSPVSASAREPAAVPRRTGAILLIEDDPDIRDLLNTFLTGEGHDVTMAEDGIVALDLVKSGAIGPCLILTDYNLPHDIDGLRAIALLREALHRSVPAIVLTGDISAKALGAIALVDCVHLAKPVKLPDLDAAVQRLLPAPDATAPVRVPPVAGDRPPVIYIVDDDEAVREAIRDVLEDDWRTVADFPTCESFLAAYRPGQEACLILDAYLPGMDGLALLKHLKEDGQSLPAIMITGSGDVQIAVQAMKAGAVDFIEKPIGRGELLTGVDRALGQARDSGKLAAWRQDAANHLAGLTNRQRQVMDMVLAGHASKKIASALGLSQRTVENHRAAIMQKTGMRSLPALARLALAAEAVTPTE